MTASEKLADAKAKSAAEKAIANFKVEGETLDARLERLQLDTERTPVSRLESLELANPHVADSVFLEIFNAPRLTRKPNIPLPQHRYAALSRGRSWCRNERTKEFVNDYIADSVGDKVTNYTVGGDDGYNRKDKVNWKVWHLAVGTETWTIAS